MALCEMAGLTPGKLGESIGLSRETIPKLIREAREGRARPGALETYARLADKYGVSIDWLAGRTDSTTFVAPDRPKP